MMLRHSAFVNFTLEAIKTLQGKKYKLLYPM